MIRTTGALHRRWLLIGAVMVIVVMVPHSQLMLRAADDPLDPTFGKDGKVSTDFLGRSGDVAHGLAIQLDGKIVAVGSVDGQFGLARYATNGSLDPAFGIHGKVVTTFNGFAVAAAVALQRDGKIVVAGTAFNLDPNGPSDFAVARYNVNGSLDATFGLGGKVTTDFANASAEARAVAIQADGKIVVVGQAITDRDNGLADMAIARYNRNGLLDLSFDGDGRVTADFDESDEARAVAVTFDGKIVVAGLASRFISLGELAGDFVVLRYRSDGSLDATFGIGGTVRTDLTGQFEVPSSVLIQRDGRIVVAGSVEGEKLKTFADVAIVRYDQNGSLDSSFGSGGVVVSDLSGIDTVAAAALQIDGKIVVASTSGTAGGLYTVSRFNTDGSSDRTFGTNGVAQADFATPDNDPIDELHAVAIEGDGKIVTAGFTFNFRTDGDINFGLIRFKASGPPAPPVPR